MVLSVSFPEIKLFFVNKLKIISFRLYMKIMRSILGYILISDIASTVELFKEGKKKV